jgi:hypothetical protein
VNAAALLAELAASGIGLTREGDNLRVRAEPGVSLAPHRERISAHKPTLLAELRLREEIVAAASAAQHAFDRQHFDTLWERWHALQTQETS